LFTIVKLTSTVLLLFTKSRWADSNIASWNQISTQRVLLDLVEIWVAFLQYALNVCIPFIMYIKVKKPDKFLGNPISEQCDFICSLGSHYATCHPTQVNSPRLNPRGMEGWVDIGDLITPRPGVEPTTTDQIQHNNNHLLFNLLPPASTSSQNYNLQTRPHSQQLPQQTGHLTDSNFFTRMLLLTFTALIFIIFLSFSDCYEIVFFLSIFE